MLGVLKRRWKPKRSSNCTRIPGTDSPEVNEKDKEKPAKLGPSIRQVHPLYEEKAQLCYEQTIVAEEVSGSPPPYPKRASLESNPSQPYPLTPNICVEAGRIQFIRQETEGDSEDVQHVPCVGKGRITVTRSSQTEQAEQYEEKQKCFENRISELEAALDAAEKNELRDKQHIAKLQKQIMKRESAQRDADRERRLRVDSETRAKQALQEAAKARSRLKFLTNEFARMEETVRSMLVYKKQAEQLRQEKTALTLAFENRCQQYQSTITRLNHEVSMLRQQLDQVGTEVNSDTLLQAHTAALQRHAEESRKQYERCLDDVANQVVRALLAQKGLKEEVGNLNNRIQELETQNRALTSMLVHHLHCDSLETTPEYESSSSQNNQEVLERTNTDSPEPSPKQSPNEVVKVCSDAVKHCNSFNSEILEGSPKKENENDELALQKIKKRLSADSEIIDSRLSLEDKKRHQILTKLWTDLKGSEVTPRKLLEALTGVDSVLWVPPQRPVSLNLQLPILQTARLKKTRPIQAQISVKSEEDTTGNESPESGNRDEGYSTMSSDVQTDATRSSAEATVSRELEDLKEATDETDLADNTRLLVADKQDTDILYIPLNLLNLKSRNSYPPGKNMLPFQHIMRSFSDSHLCIKITTAPSPCYKFSSPISSSPSIFVVDITEKPVNPLRRTKATNTLWGSNNEASDDKFTRLSWSSMAEDSTTWDAEYVQHWLRLDETRSALQHHRDMLELEYDRAELEDWSLSLSNDDLREHWKRLEAITPGQISISTLPSIQENNTLELEEDSSECLWNNSSYMMDKEGRELVTFLMDASKNCDEKPWPYAVTQQVSVSPDNSWSSGGSDCCHSHEPETCSKRSSAALSGCSDDTGELPAIGTDFTRDFYRLVKFESTKSLASTSSKAFSENGDRETTLQNVLTFIAEQQKYINSRDSKDGRRPCSVSDITKEFNIEGPQQNLEDLKNCDSDLCLNKSEPKSSDNENYVTLKQLCEEFTFSKRCDGDGESDKIDDSIQQNIAYANEICLVTPLDVESENCSNITEIPVDICSSLNVEITSIDYQSTSFPDSDNSISKSEECVDSYNGPNENESILNQEEMSESLTSNVSTTETVISRIPRRKLNASRLPLSPSKGLANDKDSKLPKSKILHKNKPKTPTAQKQQIIYINHDISPQHIISSEHLPVSSAGVLSNIIDGPPHRAVSFHERATSKDVIDELNRMIRNGDESLTVQENCSSEPTASKLDQACQSTGWVHVEKDIDLTDPKARANLLDVMMASVSSDSSPTSSCGGSVASDTTEDPPDYNQLHKIHRFHRQKKACAVCPEMVVVRASQLPPRPTIIGRPDFFVRYGEKEREAVASFDFLDELSTTSSSRTCSVDSGSVDMDDFEETSTGLLRASQV